MGTNAEKRGRNVQAPWSTTGWYSDEYWAARDPKLDELVQKEGRGRINPYGNYEDRPGKAISAMMHNPCPTLAFVPVIVWFGLFLFDKSQNVLWWAIIQLVLCLMASIFVAAITAFRIPSWHRARKAAKGYVAEHGGTFPPELLWYR